MELSIKSLGLELIENTVNAISHDQDWAVVMLGDEVPQQPADGAG